MTMLLRADAAGYSAKDQRRRDDLRNHLQSLNRSTSSKVDPESSNVWNALPGSKWGSCTDLLNAPKSRQLPKALRPKSPKDEQRSLSFSYRAPVLALPPTLPLTKAPRQMNGSEQRARTNSFGGFSSQTLLSSAPSWEADNAFVGTNDHVKMSRHEESSPERCLVTLRRPESPLPGTAQAHAQMLWIEKVRRGSEISAECNVKEPVWNSKAKETYRNYQNNGGHTTNHIEKEPYPANESHRHYMQEEQGGRNSTKVEPHRNHQKTEPSWKDTNNKLYSSQTESEPYCNTGLDSRLSTNGKVPDRNKPENESQWNNVENEPRWSNRKAEPYGNIPVNESYISHAGMETRWNTTEKELRWNSNDYSMEKKSQNNNNVGSYSSRFNQVDSDEPWNKSMSQSSLYNSDKEVHQNNKEKQANSNGTQKEEHWNNGRLPYSSPTKSESDWKATAKEPHCNGMETIQRWNNTDKEPHLNSNGSQWNNTEKESSWNQKVTEPQSEESQHQRPGAILPSRYTHSSSSASRSCNNHQGSSVEPTSPYPQRPSLTEPRTSSGDELRLATSPLYKLSSFRYGSGRESPCGVLQNGIPARGKDFPKTTPIDGKTTDRTFRDRALSQGATLPRLLNKYLSGSVNDLSRGYDDQRRSGERKLPKTSEGRITSATHHGPNQVPSNAPMISDRWRTLDREDRTSKKYVTGGSVLTPPDLYKTSRNRWASLEREERSKNGSSTHRADQISSSGNAAQLTTTRKFTFEPSDPVRKREDSSRPSSCTPSEQSPRSSTAKQGHDLESTYSNGRSRARSSGALSPSSKRLYGSEMNLASIGSKRQDPSYMAMTSARYPSGRNYDQDGINVTGSERFQSETLRLSSPKLNPAQPSGISTPHYGPPITSVQLKLIPQHSDFYNAKSNGQSKDVTRSTTVSSFNHVEPTSESSSGTLRQFNVACDSMEPRSVDYTQGMGSGSTVPLGITMTATAYPSVETKTQTLNGNRTEDNEMGFSGSNIHSSAARPIRDDVKFNREEILIDERRLVHDDAPVDLLTTSGGSATSNYPFPLAGQSTWVASSSGYSDKYSVKRREEDEEREENIAKEIFTKDDWISSARRTGKSPTPVENKTMKVIADDRKTQVHGREASTRSSDRSAPPVEWREKRDNVEASTREDERAILSNNAGLSPVKQNSNTAHTRISTAAKWKEFLNGSVETDSSNSDHSYSYNERPRQSTITIDESLGPHSNGGRQWKVDLEWTKEEGSTSQLPVERKETSGTTRSTVFDNTDEDIIPRRRVENKRKDFIVSEIPLEKASTSERSSIGNRSNMEDRVKHGDVKMEEVSQLDAKRNERDMENCDGGVLQGLRKVEIYVQRGALGVGFCVEGGLQSTSGDKPITIKRIFAGADGYLRGKLRAGDEILRVNDKDFRQMSHYNAWNFLKTLPEGPAKLLIFAK